MRDEVVFRCPKCDYTWYVVFWYDRNTHYWEPEFEEERYCPECGTEGEETLDDNRIF